ncbi:MAG: DUF2087 domain-containing protein [Betaproteobacteria bacterium]|nr:MAG: DUF2087 domain-containing protein [Betaproteobacteria bacterium]
MGATARRTLSSPSSPWAIHASETTWRPGRNGATGTIRRSSSRTRARDRARSAGGHRLSTNRTAIERREMARRALRRLLANGPLTAVPRRPTDQVLVAALAASRFDASMSHLESEVNEQLKGWLQAISEPFGIDHVTLRRLLVDLRFLTRTRSGSAYRVNMERIGEIEAVTEIEPADVLAEIRIARDKRKRRRATQKRR